MLTYECNSTLIELIMHVVLFVLSLLIIEQYKTKYPTSALNYISRSLTEPNPKEIRTQLSDFNKNIS